MLTLDQWNSFSGAVYQSPPRKSLVHWKVLTSLSWDYIRRPVPVPEKVPGSKVKFLWCESGCRLKSFHIHILGTFIIYRVVISDGYRKLRFKSMFYFLYCGTLSVSRMCLRMCPCLLSSGIQPYHFWIQTSFLYFVRFSARTTHYS